MIVALFRCLVLPHYLRPFSSPSLPPLLLSSLVQEKREKGGKKDEEYTEKKKRRKKKKIVRNNAGALPASTQPFKPWPLFEVITHWKKKRVNGRPGGVASAGTPEDRGAGSRLKEG